MIVRLLTRDDVDWALERIEAEGWTPSRPVFETILAHDPGGCFVAELDGVPAGMVTTTTFGATSWIGHLIVTADLRRRGLGTRLMEHALDHVRGRGIRTVRIEADPPGVSIYRRLGFAEEHESLRFRLEDPPTPSSTSEPILALNSQAAASFDAPLFGDDRSRFLGLLHERASSSFMIAGSDGPAGYVMTLPAARGALVGPLVATSTKVAWDLIAATMASAGSGPLTMGVPACNERAAGIVRDLGFEPRPPSLRMVLGDPAPAGRPEAIFAIASGATG